MIPAKISISLTLLFVLACPSVAFLGLGEDPVMTSETGVPVAASPTDLVDWQQPFGPSGFVPNLGQLEREDVLFYTSGHVRAGFLANGIVLCADQVEIRDQSIGPEPPLMRPAVTSISCIQIEFVGCNQVIPVGMGQRDTYYNYFLGNVPEKWRTGIHPYEEVYYPNIYDGIDIRYYTHESGLKYDFIVSPGADPADIRMRYLGADGISVSEGGGLAISTGASHLMDDAPIAFQGPAAVQASFEVVGNEVSFHIGQYDRTKPLVIDPRLAYSSYLGGTTADYGYDIEVNATRDIYVIGIAPASDFPTIPGSYDTSFNGGGVDGFVCKFSPDGATTIFATFLGGNSYDNPYDMVLDENGRIYIAGSTSSSNYPYTATAVNKTYRGGGDACLTILNPSGTGLIYSTYFGGTQYDNGNGVAIDADKNIYFCGAVYSNTPPPDFYTTPGAYSRTFSGGLQDGFVVKINANLASINYSTLLGGGSYDACNGMSADDQGNAYVTGYTASSNFPTTPGVYDTTMSSYDAIITKLNPTGTTVLCSTFLGGTNMDTGYDLVFDTAGNLYLEGYTYSTNFPTLPNSAIKTFGGYFDMFIASMSPDLTTLRASTLMGGNGWDMPRSMKVGPGGDVYMAGNTSSSNLQVTPDALNATYLGGGSDVFLSVFDANLSVLKFSTYFGGATWTDQAQGVAVDNAGNAYLTGATTSTDFWLTPNAQSKSCKGGDAFVVKILLQKYLPSAPLHLNASSGYMYVNLSWELPADDGNDLISNYRIYRAITPGAEAFLIESPSPSGYNDTSVANGVTYYYKISAKNSVGESPMSVEMASTPAGLPSEPQNLRGVCGNEFANITWDPPLDNGGDTNLTYTVYSKTGSFSYDPVLTALAKTWYNATGLINGQAYYFKVTCVNIRGEGPNSTDLMVTPITIPSAPLGLDARTGDGYAALSWLAPSDDGGSPIKGYNVYRSTTLMDPVAVAKNLTGTKFNDTGLTNGQNYKFWVRGYNTHSEGPAAGPLSATPMKRPSEAYNLTAQVGDKYVNLSWTAPLDFGGCAWVHYTILKGTSIEGMVPSATDINATYCNFTGLKNGQIYYFAVVSQNIMGEGPSSEIMDATPFTIPEQPRSLTSIGTDTTVILAWAEPKSNGGQDIAGYVIYRGMGELTLERFAKVGKVLTYTDATAVDNITYYYAVSAFNDAGEGPMSTKTTGASVYVPPVVVVDDDDVVDDDVVFDPDTDKDGLNDTWEMQYFSNLTYGPKDDPDNDGIKNSEEFQKGTDPSKSEKKPPAKTSFLGSGTFFVVVGVILLVIVCLMVIIMIMVMRRKKQEPATQPQPAPARPHPQQADIEVLPPEQQAGVQAAMQPDMAPPAPAIPAPAQPQHIEALGEDIMLPPSQDAGPMLPPPAAQATPERPMAQARVVGARTPVASKPAGQAAAARPQQATPARPGPEVPVASRPLQPAAELSK